MSKAEKHRMGKYPILEKWRDSIKSSPLFNKKKRISTCRTEDKAKELKEWIEVEFEKL